MIKSRALYDPLVVQPHAQKCTHTAHLHDFYKLVLEYFFKVVLDCVFYTFVWEVGRQKLQSLILDCCFVVEKYIFEGRILSFWEKKRSIFKWFGSCVKKEKERIWYLKMWRGKWNDLFFKGKEDGKRDEERE